MYRNRVRSKLHKNNPAVSKNIQKCKHQALLKLVSELGVHKYDTNDAPFSLSNLVKLYELELSKIIPDDFKRHQSAILRVPRTNF